jgi:signal peptidase I
MRWLSRIYRALLYTYPREFRLEYGAEMERLFRDRCGDVARAQDPLKTIRFVVDSGRDWMTTSIRERVSTARTLVAPAWKSARKSAPRGFVGEWVVTILMYLFATTTLVQAYVIPTGSMEGTLRVGDHMLVDRAAYAKPGALGRCVMPYHEVKRGDIVAFLYPEDTRQTFVKRVIGLPGDRIRMVDKQVIRNGRALMEPYTQHVDPSIRSLSRRLSRRARSVHDPARAGHV